VFFKKIENVLIGWKISRMFLFFFDQSESFKNCKNVWLVEKWMLLFRTVIVFQRYLERFDWLEKDYHPIRLFLFWPISVLQKFLISFDYSKKKCFIFFDQSSEVFQRNSECFDGLEKDYIGKILSCGLDKRKHAIYCKYHDKKGIRSYPCCFLFKEKCV